ARRKEDAVRQRALRAFYERGLYRTKNNTGVLFFLSVLERKVWILADKGIYERIGQERLDKFAMAVSQGIRDGCACDALCDAIREAGGQLASLFPITKGDIDELPNNVMIE
ncbi:MAG: TPM domain-containing protein, partial [Nitrospirae bacterium]|nr:TPM domain-containing protein [Nitrospirota bacterium]